MMRALGAVLAFAVLLGPAACKTRSTGTQGADGASHSTSSGSVRDPCTSPTQILVKKVVPPEKNPYPPADDRAKKQAALAEEAIRTFYGKRLDEAALRARMKQQPHDPALDDTRKGPDAFPFQTKRADCVKDIECWSKDYAFLSRIAGLASMFPPWIVSKVLHAHAAPWSLRRYAERTLPAAQRKITDWNKVQEEAKRDYAGTSEPIVFELPMMTLHEDEYLVDAIVQMKDREGFYHLLHVVGDDATGEPGLRYIDMVPIQNVTKWSCYH